MQQTEKLKLNLIEGGDTVSPEPINENMELLEAAVTAAADMAAQVGSGGKTCRIAWGSYAGTGKYGADNPNRLTFDFCPVLVMIRAVGPKYTATFVRDCSGGSNAWDSGVAVQVTWSDNGVSWYSATTPEYQSNASGYTWHYVALGYSN